MLEKFICIDNVGVFRKGVQTAVPLKKLALIYADNARGKSTLSSVLLACAGGDAKDLATRKTVGGTTEQKVVLRFTPEGAAPFNAEFTAGGWAGNRPNLHVFNQAFVERNVFASAGVLPEQREALLNLALGQAAVAERAEYDRQGEVQKECATKVSAAEGALMGFRGNLTVDQFINLERVDDVDARLEAADKEIGEARASTKIVSRPSLRTVPVPTFDLSFLSETLSSSFTSLAVKAERDAKAHFARHNGSETERWVAEGMLHRPDEDCPFCGQSTGQLDLFKSYKEYFDGAFTRHLQRVSGLREEIHSRLSDRQLAAWSEASEGNQGVWQLWAESIELEPLPTLDVASATARLDVVKNSLLALGEAKVRNPHDALDVSPLAVAATELASLAGAAQSYNRVVEALNQRIVNYKQKLSKPDVAALELKRKTLAVRKGRYEAASVQLIDAIKLARANYKAAEKAKDAARAALDSLMADTLAQFEVAINAWLLKFAAPFKIEKLAPTYIGGRARSEYVLKVRGVSVNIGPGGGGDLSFHAALSEGDKRTLAFAFFLAKLFADSEKARAVVVLDDVFTSLDKHRRHHTLDAVLRILAECAQVVALGHDAHFLRELKKRASKKKVAESVELALQRDANDFSHIDGKFDLDDYCSSEYYKHYVLVERYVAAEPGCDRLDVAKALRPLIEGHLHRCFPKKFKEGQTVGDMLDQVKTAVSPSPLARLQSLHSDLVSFNDFAAAFHHDTSGGYPRSEVNDAELLHFAKGAIGFIQARSFRPD
jgi:wobble nucleotide-excising tRNase